MRASLLYLFITTLCFLPMLSIEETFFLGSWQFVEAGAGLGLPPTPQEHLALLDREGGNVGNIAASN
jgi:hypothetical protein